MTLVERVKRMLLSPRTEWEVIDAEPTTPAALYTGYIIPLAAVGPLARAIGYSLFGIAGLMGTYRVPIGASLTNGLLLYILTLAGTYILAMVIDGLAPTFNGQRNRTQALKLVAYSGTAFWVAGIVMLIPAISVLVILGAFYSLYLLYLGLPKLMRSPADKTVGYAAVVTVALLVLFLVISAIAGRFMPVPTAAITVP
jgi:Yip1-like protein